MTWTRRVRLDNRPNWAQRALVPSARGRYGIAYARRRPQIDHPSYGRRLRFLDLRDPYLDWIAKLDRRCPTGLMIKHFDPAARIIRIEQRNWRMDNRYAEDRG